MHWDVSGGNEPRRVVRAWRQAAVRRPGYIGTMPSSIAIHSGFSPEAYLAWEREQELKHEHLDGEVYAMSGGSRKHSLLASNTLTTLSLALRSQACQVLTSDMRIKVEATGLYSYPDVSVVCGQARFEDERENSLLNPVVLVEILSDSTEAWDRGRKFEHCRTIPSLMHYLLVSQHAVLMELFTRRSGGSWLLHESRAGGLVQLAAIEVDLAVDEV